MSLQTFLVVLSIYLYLCGSAIVFIVSKNYVMSGMVLWTIFWPVLPFAIGAMFVWEYWLSMDEERYFKAMQRRIKRRKKSRS